jgi:hypothetical protein
VDREAVRCTESDLYIDIGCGAGHVVGIVIVVIGDEVDILVAETHGYAEKESVMGVRGRSAKTE